MNYKEWLYLIPLCLIGLLFGYSYTSCEHLFKKISNKFNNKVILSCILAGLILGISGTLLPYTMFSGEEAMHEIANNFTTIGAVILLLTGFIKLIITNSCISLGFKGGHFFPTILSGVSIGLAFSILLRY